MKIKKHRKNLKVLYENTHNTCVKKNPLINKSGFLI